MSKRIDLKCCGESVTMVVDNDGVTFEGWDEDAELALLELGFEPSLCWIVADAIKNERLDKTLLAQATIGNALAVELLLAANANVSTTDGTPWTPLHLAAHNHHADVAALLIAADAPVYAIDEFGNTPLHLAARDRCTDIVDLLIAAGAFVNVRDGHGMTPLHWAAAFGRDDVVEILRTANADVNSRCNEGDTPLDLAKRNRQHSTVAALEAWIADHKQR